MRAAILAAVAVVGCTGDEIEITSRDQVPTDHGHSSVVEIVTGHAKRPPTPESYASLLAEIDAVRGELDQESAALAELYLSFYALPVVLEQMKLPREQQLENLAFTVFPVAFRVPPQPGEEKRDYFLRLCGQERPEVCKEYVPAAWSLVLPARARRALKHRAIEALDGCIVCANEDVMRRELELFSEKVAAEDAFVEREDDRYDPDQWPLAAERAAPWGDHLLMSFVGDHAQLDGAPLPAGSWVEPLRAARAGRKVLGIHMPPDARVDTLRGIAQDARAAGFSELALQVRGRRYPYEPREYRISLADRRAKPLAVRGSDTIQMLARTLDFTNPADGPPRRL